MPDYIPLTDSAFNTWVLQYQAYMAANIAGLAPLVAGDVTALGDAVDQWTSDYTAHIAAQSSALAATSAKKLARETLVDLVRKQASRVQPSPTMTDIHRAGLGITIADTTPTAVEAPTSNPVLQADTSNRLQIVVSFADEGTPTSKAKPAGVSGCEIWMKVDGAPPTDLDDCEFVTLDTRTPHTIAFDGADGGKTVHLIGRWVSTRGDKGPLSETVSATVPG